MNSVIDPSANIHESVKIGPFCLIGPNVTIGPNCILQKGITIGDRVVIGAMSFVNKNIDSNQKFAGCPAKYIGKI